MSASPPPSGDDDGRSVERLARRAERERAARKEAEQLLEAKSAELYEANQRLLAFNQRLETLVADRTAALREALDRAESGTRAKSAFLATMSHEIRTPLNGVVGMVELLRGTALDDEQRRYVETLLQSADTLLAIVNHVLDFSKIEAGRLELEQRPFSPAGLANDVVALLRPQAEQKSLALSLVTESLPAQLVGDPTRLQQVWINLLSNAIKFTERGGVGFSLVARDAGQGRWILSGSVVDTGIGISLQHQARLFEAFTQGESSTTRRFGGSGLGLTISARLMRLMGGSIVVQSRPGHGSRFDFEVTLQASPMSEPAGAAPDETGTAQLSRLRVLVAEDNRVNQVLALNVLRTLGIEAALARDGAEAIRTVAGGDYDVVLMDMQMPEVDGLEATRAIRARGDELRQPWIIAMTANAFEQDRERCLESGMDAFVGKPFRIQELRDLLLHAARRLAEGGR
jgi:two-component system, sensor histidine kinase